MVWVDGIVGRLFFTGDDSFDVCLLGGYVSDAGFLCLVLSVYFGVWGFLLVDFLPGMLLVAIDCLLFLIFVWLLLCIYCLGWLRCLCGTL